MLARIVRAGALATAMSLASQATALPASAQTPAPTRTSADSTHPRTAGVTVLTSTVVTASRERQRRTETSATIDALSGSEIARSKPSHPAELLNRIAGVHVSELSAEGHSTAIRQPLTTKPMYLYLEDGVPTRATGFFNHNALYEVNVPQAGGIEVMKGPGTALYGSDAIGGIVNVLTRPAGPKPSLDASFEGGSQGYGRFLGSGAFRTAKNAVRADLNLTRSTGWRDLADYDRASGTVRWDTYSASGWTARTVATATSVDQHDVPTLNGALFDARSPVNLAPIATRGVRAARLSSAIEKESDGTLWSVTPYLRHDVLDIVPSWQLGYDPQVWDTRNNSAGALLKVRRDVAPLHAQIIVGTDLDYSPGSFTAVQAKLARVGGTNGAPVSAPSYARGVTQYDYDVAYRSASPYVQTQWTVTSKLRVDAGARYDLAGYAYTTHLAPVDTGTHRIPASTSVSYAHLSPKLGLTYDVTPSLNVYASYRHGFRAPAQSQLFQQNSAVNTVGLRPVRANSIEGGVRGALGSHVAYELDAYDMTIDDDIVTYVTPQNTREATNAGETRHRGVETSLGVQLAPSLRADVSYSRTSQRYVSWSPSATTSYAGKVIEGAPRDLGDLLVTWAPSALRGGRAAVEVVHVGEYAMDPANTHYYGGYRTATLMLDYPAFRNGSLFVRVNNVTNRNFAEVVTYDAFQKEQYQPGDPRTVRVGARMSWVR